MFLLGGVWNGRSVVVIGNAGTNLILSSSFILHHGAFKAWSLGFCFCISLARALWLFWVCGQLIFERIFFGVVVGLEVDGSES
jgi:hypothetical protein